MTSADARERYWNLGKAWGIHLAVFAGIAASVAGCGDASRGAKTAEAPRDALATQSPDEAPRLGVAVRVAGHLIKVAEFDHSLSAEVENEPASARFVPPNYTACIAHHREVSGESATAAVVASLKSRCEKDYQDLRSEVLSRLISPFWVIGEARELGLDANRGEIERLLRRSEFTYREAREQLDAEAIRHRIKEQVGPMTEARIAAYYRSHRRQFTDPEKRDLRIVRVRTKSSALAVRRELEAGSSFASVAQTITTHEPRLQQPFKSNKALVLGLTPGRYNEPRLDRAIFKATPGKLVGPVNVIFRFPGFFVFEVTKITPAHQKPLSAVAPSLRRDLPEGLYRQKLARFIAAWRAKWRARTDCKPGFVVTKCRQFRPSSVSPRQDPYSLA